MECCVCECKYLIHEFSAAWSFTQTGDLAFVRLIGIKQVVIPANTTPYMVYHSTLNMFI